MKVAASELLYAFACEMEKKVQLMNESVSSSSVV